ncbi:DUF2529 domain-containing protein [Falsibacillus pallidus]|uniref:Uncharacterized protein DUF2529 n=1 Tax=Falsibacillus pallidus TaxID=493781 RepID=A0A370GGP9_9BACI|nr:DUF2529 domain-containing protein [Falsibacillus pallidus]RDI41554.1 uncharacterized protein DUF2529 [Falsibacillus pallidus]
MLKMFTTQLAGLFNRLFDKEELSIEDEARLLAQAAVGEGKIYIKGFKEMGAVEMEAIHGAEPLAHSALLMDETKLTDADRVLIVSRFSTDEEAVGLAKRLVEKGLPFAAISGAVKDPGKEDLVSLADAHLDTKVLKGLLPGEDGERVGMPTSMAALYLYFGLKFTIEEILEEYE